MQLISLSLSLFFLMNLFISQEYISATTCREYQEILNGKSFSPFDYPSTAQFYSQAPPGSFIGECNNIPCIGSPVFLVEQAHTYIDQQFDVNNKYSSVEYLCYHKNTSKAASNSVLYRLIFKLSNYNNTKYIGVELDSGIQGLANAQYNRVILHQDLDLVKKVLGVEKLACKPQLVCGDQKMLYSYYNRDSSSQLNYPYAGNNYNTVQDYLLNQIDRENNPNYKRVCTSAHYYRVFNRSLGNYFRDETLSITPPIREIMYCNPSGISINRIRIGCRTTGKYTVDNLEAFQFIAQDTVTADLEPKRIQGNPGLADRYFMDISLYGSTEVAIEFWGPDRIKQDNTSVRNQLRIVTYDARGKQIDEIRCGEYFNHNLVRTERMQSEDFLGFWYNYDGRSNIQRLGVIRYED